jgi:hypothetical protein
MPDRLQQSLAGIRTRQNKILGGGSPVSGRAAADGEGSRHCLSRGIDVPRRPTAPPERFA